MIGRLLHTLNLLLVTLILVVVLVVASFYFWLNQDLPQLPKNLQQINLSLPTEIYSSDGERIKILGERHPIALEDISPFFTKAITAVEDSRFYRHSGIDHTGLVRALWTNLR